eukprot:TRINITY_DN7983_c0_g1_i1.p1 TRINITY_DN7983_c0_g1~~TRINITY_DN7983_c0_g1_i1.p1  ORF type:complete len:177 (-),score=20.35 TRINITY_DN7983_c0_g1_i1:25-555(-)
MDSYEHELRDLLRSAEMDLNQLSSGQNDALLASAVAHLNEARSILPLLSLQKAGQTDVRVRLTNIESYNKQISELEARVERARDASARTALLARPSLGSNANKSSVDQRQQALSTTDRARASSQELRSALALAEDTLLVAGEAAENLNRQTETLNRVKSNLKSTNESLQKAEKSIK